MYLVVSVERVAKLVPDYLWNLIVSEIFKKVFVKEISSFDSHFTEISSYVTSSQNVRKNLLSHLYYKAHQIPKLSSHLAVVFAQFIGAGY